MENNNIITEPVSTSIPINVSEQQILQEDLKDSPSPHKNTRDRPLIRTTLVQNKLETYSLDDKGDPELAKKHRNANRPLKVLGDLSEDNIENINFCHCCDLPCEKKGVIEPFSMCDNTDIFAKCGIGISLYYLFFKFVIIITFLGLLSLSVVLMVLNMEYSKGIKDVCNSKYKNLDDTNFGNCFGYVTDSNNDENYYRMFNQWLQRFSSDNIFIYRKLSKTLRGTLNKNVDDVLVNYSLINFLFLITTFILNIILLFLMRAEIKRLKLDNITIRDYTVLISNSKKILISYLDQQYKGRLGVRQSRIAVENFSDFKRYVNEYLKNDKQLNDITIEHINICYQLGNYLPLMHEFEETKRNIFSVNNNPTTIERNTQRNLLDDERRHYKYPFGFLGIYCCPIEGKSLKELKEEKDNLDKKLKQEEDRIREIVREKDITDYMLISFRSIKDKKKFMNKYPKDFLGDILYFFKNIEYYLCPCCIDKEKRKLFWRGRGIRARDPPEPDDIIWENFKYSFLQRIQRTIITYLICILIIAVSFGMVFGLSYLQEQLYGDDTENGDSNIVLKYLTSLSITVVISIINTLIQLVLEKLTYMEKPISKSNYVLSLSVTLFIFTFLNSAIVPLICKYIVAIQKEDNQERTIDYYVKRKRDDLIIDDMFIYFVVNAIITPLFWKFNFTYLYKCIKIKCLNKEKIHMTQKKLNELYEYPDMDLAYKLSYLVKTLSMCFFYFAIFPEGFIIAFIGFIFAYWIEKYIFTHQCKRPDMLDEIIQKYYANYFIVVLFIGSIGDYIFLHNAFDTNAWTLINIILFGVLIIVPYTKFITCDFVDSESTGFRYKPLNDIYFTFYTDYQRENPLTKKLGLETYLNALKNEGYLTDNAYNLGMENIEKLNLMEMYYGTTTGNAPLLQQSILNNVQSDSILNMKNIRSSIIGGRGLKSTVVRPELKDNMEAKMRKRIFFESQMRNLFGKGNNKGIGDKGQLDGIKEVNEDDVKNSKIDDIKRRIDEMPETEIKYKDDTNNTNININDSNNNK